MDRRVAVKRYATVQRHEAPRITSERSVPQAWSRSSARAISDVPVKENQIIRGLVVGLPLAIVLWLVLALLVWMTF
jgi:hypothetical protein